MSEGWGQCPDYFLGPGIPVLNWQVVVELHVLSIGKFQFEFCEEC